MRCALTLVLLVLPALAAAARPLPERPLRGAAWLPPADPREAAGEVFAMRAFGIEAVRMPFTTEEAVLSAADRAGVWLFIDLPVAHLPAPLLRDTLAFAERQLETLIALAARHPSIYAVGLARGVDTSVPEACAYFARLAEQARQAGLVTYYRTRFIESDACSGAVDFVLLDARDREPGPLLARWRHHHETPAGVLLGAEVHDEVTGGHLTPRSPAAQARTIEDGLRALLMTRHPPRAVFIHQWRGPTFGIHAPDGTPRPAASVVSGFYTGRQTVFAIDAGPAPPAPPGATAFMLVGWLTVLLLVLVLTAAPRFRELIPQYFVRHGYYRETIQRSASIEGPATAGMALALAIAAGIAFGVMIHALTRADVIEVLAAGWHEARQEVLRTSLQRPVLLVVVGAGLYWVWLMLNMLWLRALAGRRYRVRAQQAATLAVLSRWAVFPLAVLALLAAQSENPLMWLPWLLGLWVVIEVVALPRMLYDYARIARVPMGRAVGAGMGVPVVLVTAAALAATMAAGPQLSFLWHLATRT